jgi:hypothetical protein
MTKVARQVLGDAATALADFEASAGTAYWRTRWVALVALLRAVGHILDKVDAAADPRLGRASGAAWRKLGTTKPEPRVFWDFIDDERNNVLKAYQFGAGLNITVRPGAAWRNTVTGESGGTESGPTTYDTFMRSGSFAGEDPRELARRAIGFWTAYLDGIDRAAAAGVD